MNTLINYGVLVGLCTLMALLYFFDPSAPNSIFPPCPTNWLSGLHCPGCGSLRAMHALVHGEFKEAVSQNVLTVIFLPIIPLMVFAPSLFKKTIVPIFIFILFAVFTVLRNIEAFSFLAPH